MQNENTALEAYTPTTLPSDVWARLRPFVLKTIRANYAVGRSVEDVYRSLMTLTGFADWIVTVGVGDLDERILREDVINAYTQFRASEIKPTLAERERKRLLTIAGFAGTLEKRPVKTTSDPSTPYTKDEEGLIRRWAAWQATPAHRRDATAIAALGLGCGLSPAEVMSARIGDVVPLDDGLLGVRASGRWVPVLESWHPELAAVLGGNSDQYLVRPGFTDRTSGGLRGVLKLLTEPRFSVQRMRATWMLAHVDAGTPMPDFLETAAVTSAVYERLVPFAARADASNRTRTLRLSKEVAR